MCTIAAPDMRERLAAGAPEPASNTPDQSRAMMANALQRWACVVKDAGVRQE
jgi:tripartite-type tricarboxylate transporter receptor subunit TctC